jgi:hypothetical protein
MGIKRTEVSGLTEPENLELFRKDITRFLEEVKSRKKAEPGKALLGEVRVELPDGSLTLELETIEELQELLRLNRDELELETRRASGVAQTQSR